MSRRINIPIVFSVAAICGAAMTVFFVNEHKKNIASLQFEDTISEKVCTHVLTQEELDYYNDVASDYLKTLPDDKTVMEVLINDSIHHIYYFEKSFAPSCYAFDLESLTTSVLFGGVGGFYIDTKLLIVGSIIDWRRVGNNFVFIARNRAPEVDDTNNVLIFAVGMFDQSRLFIDNASEAYFTDDNHVLANYAKLLYQDQTSGRGVYSKYSVTIDLSKLLQ